MSKSLRQAPLSSGLASLRGERPAREARDAFGVAGPSGARETGFGAGDPPGLGKRNASRARIVTGLRPRAPARQGRTLRGRYGACWRSPGCAGAGEAGRPPAAPARSGVPATSLHSSSLRPQACETCAAGSASAATTDASGASLGLRTRPLWPSLGLLSRTKREHYAAASAMAARVIPALVAGIPVFWRCGSKTGMAGTRPAMTGRRRRDRGPATRGQPLPTGLGLARDLLFPAQVGNTRLALGESWRGGVVRQGERS